MNNGVFRQELVDPFGFYAPRGHQRNAFNRGALSADTLRSMGYKNAKFIAGGLKAYREQT
jgi:hypothetical protein